MYTSKVLTGSCFIKQKIKIKNGFGRVVYSVLVVIKHKENCLSINGQQPVKLEEGIIKFENYLKQIPFHFKIYADFEFNS